MLRWGIMSSTAGEKVQGTVRGPRYFKAAGPGMGGGTAKADGRQYLSLGPAAQESQRRD